MEMAEFLIRGGKKIKGEIEVRGAKNSALKILPASILFANPIGITNLPLIEDVFRMLELLKALGIRVEKPNGRSLKLGGSEVKIGHLRSDIAERFRASIVLAGPLLAIGKTVTFPHPGGCVIGKRPIDIFLDGWRSMGAKIRSNKSSYTIEAKRLVGSQFIFRKVSVTATETLMLTAVLAHGKTVLKNAAMEPEISSLAKFLNKNGAKIKGAGTSTVEIIGTGGKLLRGGKTFQVIPDRIEAGDFLILGAALKSRLRVIKCNPEHLEAIITMLRAGGANIKSGHDWVEIRPGRALSGLDVTTREYPGFVTDLQAPFTVLMTQAMGDSMIFETVFDGRLNYVEDLVRMGANVTILDPHRVLVHGPTKLHGREIESPDLRAGLAFIIAAMVAEGNSVVKNIYQIDRGYEKIEERLQKIGADIRRVG